MAAHTTTWGASICPSCSTILSMEDSPYTGMTWEQECPRCHALLMLRVVELHIVRLRSEEGPPMEMAETTATAMSQDGSEQPLYRFRGGRAVGAALGCPDDWQRWERTDWPEEG